MKHIRATIEIQEGENGVEFRVKVVPGASRTRIAGVLGGAVKIAVAAPAEAGKANAAVIDLLARALSVRRGDVQIVQGNTTPRKRIRVAGLSAADIRTRLSL